MNHSQKITVGIVDDHWQTRDGLHFFINSLPDFEVILIAENGNDLIQQEKMGKPLPQILLMDIRMAGMDGIATTEWVHKNHPGIRVIGLSAAYPADSKNMMMKYGCVGFLNKTDDYGVFRKALEDVAEIGIMADCVMQLGEVIKNNIQLTGRESEFLQWICSNLNMEQIGNKMCLSLKSIEGYNARLHKKLGEKTRQGLINKAYEHGFAKRNVLDIY